MDKLIISLLTVSIFPPPCSGMWSSVTPQKALNFPIFCQVTLKDVLLFPDDADLNNARLLYIVLCCMTLARPTRLLGT